MLAEHCCALAASVTYSPPQHVPGLPFNAAAFFSSLPEIPPLRTDGRRHALTLTPPTYCALRSCYISTPVEVANSPRSSPNAARYQDARTVGRVDFPFPSRAPPECSLLLRTPHRCYSGRSLAVAAAKWELGMLAHVAPGLGSRRCVRRHDMD